MKELLQRELYSTPKATNSTGTTKMIYSAIRLLKSVLWCTEKYLVKAVKYDT